MEAVRISPPMRIDEFRSAQALLPEDLRYRAGEIQSCVTGRRTCPPCRVAGRVLERTLHAAGEGLPAAARELLDEAEHYVYDGDHRAGCRWARRTAVLLRLPQVHDARSGIHGQVPRWAQTTELIAATDASWKDDRGGLGYIVTDGRWGLRSWESDRFDPTGQSKVLVSELRAVELMFAEVGDVPGLLLLVDSLPALRFLRAWHQGRVELMPQGYDLRPRSSGPPTLVRLARRVSTLPGLRLRHVKGHSLHQLNEAADSLSKIGRRADPDAADRADRLVRAFLLDWHEKRSATG